jgi:hypothetical protein
MSGLLIRIGLEMRYEQEGAIQKGTPRREITGRQDLPSGPTMRGESDGHTPRDMKDPLTEGCRRESQIELLREQDTVQKRDITAQTAKTNCIQIQTAVSCADGAGHMKRDRGVWITRGNLNIENHLG